MKKIGQSPVTLSREVPGFALNRIQYAIINECWSMYKVRFVMLSTYRWLIGLYLDSNFMIFRMVSLRYHHLFLCI